MSSPHLMWLLCMTIWGFYKMGTYPMEGRKNFRKAGGKEAPHEFT